MKNSSPAPPSKKGDASDHPEGEEKQASLKREASGHLVIKSIKEAEKPKIIKIKKKIAEFSPSLHCNAEEIGRLIEILENNGYEVEDGIDVEFVIYRVIWIKAISEEE